MRWVMAFAGVSCLTACEGADGGDGRDESEVISLPLTAAQDWSVAPATADPFVENEPGRLRCSAFALRQEASWLEVSTMGCNYATLLYELTGVLPAHSLIRGQITWARLAALEPALATLAFATEDGVLWTHEVTIPGDAGVVDVEIDLASAAPAGSGLFFHVRNHGYNTWQLSPLTLERIP